MTDTPGSNPWDNLPGAGDPTLGGATPPPGPGQPGFTPPTGGAPGAPGQPGFQPPVPGSAAPGGGQPNFNQPQPGAAPGAQPSFGQPQPGFGAPPTPPKRNLKPWFIGCGGLALLGILACGGCLFLAAQSATEPVDRANEFMSLIADEDYDGAEELVDSDCFSGINIVQIYESADLGPKLANRDLSPGSRLDFQDDDRDGRRVEGTINVDGDERDIEIDMIDDDDGWFVCSIDFDFS